MHRQALASFLTLGACLLQTRGHSHLEIVYRQNRLSLVHLDFDEGESNPDAVVLTVGSSAARPIPDVPAFTELLGEAGATIWILPESSSPDLLWLGIGNGSLLATDFAGPITLSLHSVDGPGHFALFRNDAFGSPLIRMNSRDGVDSTDSVSMPLGSHIHGNWAFSAPGTYRVKLTASGTLRATGAGIASTPTVFHFEVEPPPSPVLAMTLSETNTLRFTLRARPGLNYRIESSDAFSEWVRLTDLHAADPFVTHSLPFPSAPFRFFRARFR
ncbi:MAG: choice-of-anchor M domain-containing protein [Verrucomicrobiales bacterium]|nr:choice-of-anchor M domain-containing protein [Verrucomicrobiales bacterium]